MQEGSVTQAMSLCTKIGKPKQEHAKYLASLFPSTSTPNPKSSVNFDPIKDSVNTDRRLKKKGARRSRAFKLWVVVGEKMFTTIPKSSVRKKMNKEGRIKKLEFRRTMASSQVKKIIVEAFPTLKLESPIFMKSVDMKMVTANIEGDEYPCGSIIHSIASKESLYVVESEVRT